jgi:hypothetical protein
VLASSRLSTWPVSVAAFALGLEPTAVRETALGVLYTLNVRGVVFRVIGSGVTRAKPLLPLAVPPSTKQYIPAATSPAGVLSASAARVRLYEPASVVVTT